MSKSINKLTSELQLIVDSELEDLVLASQNLNPFLTYVRFILTDSMPNANGHIIPQEEFSNLIQTGLYMPLKMAQGEIKEGHDDAIPLGVITHLRVDGNKIRGVAALWNKERPADIAFIKERYADGESLDLSWEIGFDPDESQYNDDGYLVLRGCVLRATTLVGIPAYMGRTNITDVDMSSDKSKEEETVTELEKKIETLTTELQAAKERITELEETQITPEQKAELERLQEFEAEVLAEAKRLERLQEIRDTFEQAGVEKPDDFFEDNEEQLLAMKEGNMLDFFIANLVSEEEEEDEPADDDEELEGDDEEPEGDEEDIEEEEASTKNKLPKIRNIKVGDENYTPTEIAQMLRDRRANKQSK
jgi:hypothetical protein